MTPRIDGFETLLAEARSESDFEDRQASHLFDLDVGRARETAQNGCDLICSPQHRLKFIAEHFDCDGSKSFKV